MVKFVRHINLKCYENGNRQVESKEDIRNLKLIITVQQYKLKRMRHNLILQIMKRKQEVISIFLIILNDHESGDLQYQNFFGYKI